MRSTAHVSKQPGPWPHRAPRRGLVESRGATPPVARQREWQPSGVVRASGSAEPEVDPSTWLLLIVACSLLLAPVSATAQESSGQQGLTLETAVGRALAHYPTVTAAAAAEAEARAVLGEAQAARLPDVQVRGSATRYQKPMLVSPIHAFQAGLTPPFDETLLQTVVSGTYTLFDGGARRAQIGQARSQVDAAAAASRSARDVVIAQVVASYSRVLGRSRALDAHDRRIAALDGERSRVEQMRAVGRAADLEVLRVSATVETARAERAEIAEALDIAERELARLVGADPGEARAARLDPLALVDRREPDREELVAAALDASPVLETADTGWPQPRRPSVRARAPGARNSRRLETSSASAARPDTSRANGTQASRSSSRSSTAAPPDSGSRAPGRHATRPPSRSGTSSCSFAARSIAPCPRCARPARASPVSRAPSCSSRKSCASRSCGSRQAQGFRPTTSPRKPICWQPVPAWRTCGTPKSSHVSSWLEPPGCSTRPRSPNFSR
jgi:hypothetical protein